MWKLRYSRVELDFEETVLRSGRQEETASQPSVNLVVRKSHGLPRPPVAALNNLPGVRELHIHVHITAINDSSLCTYSFPRLRLFVQDILILLSNSNAPARRCSRGLCLSCTCDGLCHPLRVEY